MIKADFKFCKLFKIDYYVNISQLTFYILLSVNIIFLIRTPNLNFVNCLPLKPVNLLSGANGKNKRIYTGKTYLYER